MIAPIEIQLSKQKLILLLIGATVFVLLGIRFQFLASNSPIVNNPVFNNPFLLRILGILSISFFGFVGFYILRKIGDKSPGLIITNEGITDNASGVSAGFIPWKDIIEIKEVVVARQKILMPIVNNPLEYIDRQKSFISKKAMEMNYKTYGSPISITSNGLKCSYTELKNLLSNNLTTNLKQPK